MINVHSISLDSILWNGNIKEIQPTHTPTIITITWEAVDVSKWGHRLVSLCSAFKKNNPSRTLILIINSWYINHLNHLDLSSIDQVVYLDFFLTMTYDRVVNQKNSELVTVWEPKFFKFLFLTGKPDKQHRIGLLYKLYKNNLLNQANWSLVTSKNILEKTKRFLPTLSSDEATQFIKQHIKTPDDAKFLYHTNSVHYCGIPYNKALYQECDFQLISETDFNKDWITEKTWLSIINRRPFIIASGCNTLAKLKKLGFQTYEQYLKISDYDSIVDNDKRLNAIVINTQDWLKNIKNNQLKIHNDTEHNFLQLQKLADANIKKLKLLIDTYNINCLPNEILPLYDQQAERWKIWYNNIKDPTWPECPFEQDFKNLPEIIQHECINNFGYKP